MSPPLDVALNINGEERTLRVEPFETLLTSLRDRLHLTAAKRGCNQGVCGACTVLSDGQPVRACLSLTLDCADRRIDTIEGLSEAPIMHALQRAFIAAGAFQCGFCTPGMLIAAFALLTANRCPSAGDVRRALSGNLCRCTGYQKIVTAVLDAAHALPAEAAA